MRILDIILWLKKKYNALEGNSKILWLSITKCLCLLNDLKSLPKVFWSVIIACTMKPNTDLLAVKQQYYEKIWHLSSIPKFLKKPYKFSTFLSNYFSCWMQWKIPISFRLIVIGFDWSDLCPHEASGKLNYRYLCMRLRIVLHYLLWSDSFKKIFNYL